MNLYTKNNNECDMIVDIFISYSNNITPTINNTDTFKLLVLKSGTLHIQSKDNSLLIVAPAIICLSNTDNISILDSSNFESVIIYFKPTVIHDSFTYSMLANSNFEEMFGTTLYQDYLLIKKFILSNSHFSNIYYITNNSLLSILNMIDKMHYELSNQYDGYWPCRSRSYFIQLLFFINYSCINNDIKENTFSDPLIGNIINYLNEHISEKILLKDITKEFNLNRNNLNQLFINNTNTTCLNYLLDMRIDLAKIMLSETELPICEISERVGFLDTNYFTKVFKKSNSLTPTDYRKKRMSQKL